MKRASVLLALSASLLVACSSMSSDSGGWTTLIDGEKGLDNFTQTGNANWHAEAGAIVADKGVGLLVTRASYSDFQLRAEFWAATDTNSGIYIRCTDPAKINSTTAYEVNIWDIRPEPKYGTGAIVNVAPVAVPIANRAGGKWNVYEITAKGPQFTVRLNGAPTSSGQDGKFASGLIALQMAAGVKDVPGGPIKWRKVQIRPL
jgi:hypothetical protein